MKYLVDTNILSEATKPAPQVRVVEWLQTHRQESAVSSVVLGELELGILSLPVGQRRARLEQWFKELQAAIPVLSFDAKVASEWAGMMASLKGKGLSMAVKDSLIAATAREHHLTVVTRNTNDFRHAGVPLLNPFEEPTAK